MTVSRAEPQLTKRLEEARHVASVLNVMDRIITIIVLLFLHLHFFELIFDKLKTELRPTLFSGEPLSSGQFSRPREWPLNRGSTVLRYIRVVFATLFSVSEKVR